jgi:hypothetical protein
VPQLLLAFAQYPGRSISTSLPNCFRVS